MKKNIALLLALAMCFSLCACGSLESTPMSEPTPNPAEILYDKYSDIIDALEAEDYEQASAALAARIPAPTVEEVEITMDNIWDYFEITENRDESKDAQGNLTSLSISYVLSLKDTYIIADVNNYPTKVSVGYEYDYAQEGYRGGTVDFDTMTCDGNVFYNQNYHESKMIDFTESGCILYGEFISPAGGNEIVFQSISSFELINASGKVYLLTN